MSTRTTQILLFLAAVVFLLSACNKEPLEETIPAPPSLWVSQVDEGDTLFVNAACLETVTVEVRGISKEATFAWTLGNQRTSSITIDRAGTQEQLYEYQVTITDTDAVYNRLVQVLFADTDSFSKEPFIYETIVPRGGGAFLIEKPKCAFWVRMVLYDADSGDEIYRYNASGRPLWDGRYKGNPAPVGYYYYTLELVFFDGTQSQYDGVIELLR